MKQHVSVYGAIDCPALNGGPVSLSHEGRLSSMAIQKKDQISKPNTAQINANQKKHEIIEASPR